MTVNRVRQHFHLLRHLRDRHLGAALQQLRQRAFVVGGQMQNDHERHAAVVRRIRKELAQRLNCARRTAQADNRQRVRFAGQSFFRRPFAWLGHCHSISSMTKR